MFAILTVVLKPFEPHTVAISYTTSSTRSTLHNHALLLTASTCRVRSWGRAWLCPVHWYTPFPKPWNMSFFAFYSIFGLLLAPLQWSNFLWGLNISESTWTFLNYCFTTFSRVLGTELSWAINDYVANLWLGLKVSNFYSTGQKRFSQDWF